MQIDRRTMLAGGAALLASAPALAKSQGARPTGTTGRSSSMRWAASAIPMSPEEQLRLERSGLGGDGRDRRHRCCATRSCRSATGPTRGATIKEDIALKQNILNANPDRLMLVRTAADILKAKREKKFGVVLGTQDTAMVGPELDRLAQLKKDGVMTVQLTYNNRNLAGDGALEPANAGLSKLGRATIERIEAEKLLLDLSHGGREDDGRGGGPCEAAAGHQPYRRRGR